MINIQDEVIKIHHKYGTSEKANYEIQLLSERYAKQYHQEQVTLGLPSVSNSKKFTKCLLCEYIACEPHLRCLKEMT